MRDIGREKEERVRATVILVGEKNGRGGRGQERGDGRERHLDLLFSRILETVLHLLTPGAAKLNELCCF